MDKNFFFGFCKLITYNQMSKGRLVIKNEMSECNYTLTIGAYIKINTEIEYDDFNRIETIPINHDTDSFQIRAKAVYKDNKGYFVKLNGKKEYLNNIYSKSLESIFDYVEIKCWLDINMCGMM